MRILFIAVLSLNVFLQGADKTAIQGLVVYQSGDFFVQESRAVKLSVGTHELRLANFPATLKVEKVNLTLPDGFEILQHTFLPPLVDPGSYFQAARGKEVQLVLDGDHKVKGVLKAADNQGLIVNDGQIRWIARPKIRMVTFPNTLQESPAELRLVIKGSRKYRGSVQLQYAAQGIGWRTQYRAQFDEAEHKLLMSGDFVITNNTRLSYTPLSLTLVAGEVHREGAPPRFLRMARAAAAMEQATSPQPAGEYYIYTIDREIILPAQQTTVIPWMTAMPLAVKSHYVLENAGPTWSNVELRLEMLNKPTAGMAQPLPAGEVAFYLKAEQEEKTDLWLGEDRLPAAAVGDTLKFRVGKAFDVKGKRTVLEVSRKSRKYHQERIEVLLKNAKDHQIAVEVIETLPGNNWEIIKSNFSHRKLDNRRVMFSIPVAAHKTSRLVYTFRQTFR